MSTSVVLQVMYMMSLLGRGIESQNAECVVKDYVAKNTFVLFLQAMYMNSLLFYR